jgi:hypothetical protein
LGGVRPELEFGGATRKARPWRPVKPFDMICEVEQRWVRQREQRRMERLPQRNGGWEGGLVPGEKEPSEVSERFVATVEVLLRRRKGRVGIR